MIVRYCSLCNCPIKTEGYVLYSRKIYEDPVQINSMEEFKEQMKEEEKNVKDMCNKCKEIFDKIFELRKENLDKISNELLGIYNLSNEGENNDN